MIKILVVSFISVLLLSIIKQYKSDYAIILKLAIIILIAFIAFEIYENSGIQFSFLTDTQIQTPSYFPIIFKTLGIVLITQISSSICKENGEESLSLIVELVGKLSVLLISIPLIETLYQIMKSYLEM